MTAKLTRIRNLLICLALIGLTLAVYGQVWRFGLAGIDDDTYITHNPYVQIGLTRDTAKWAFTSFYDGNWIPTVWLSLMCDTNITRYLAGCGISFGQESAGVYHISNVLGHAISSIILFLIFLKMTGSTYRSAFVAAIFAVHPLHVESVAWVTERKDTLSAVFWMLTMLAYVNYTKRPSVARYLIIVLCFSIGLMTKSMLVTLPVMLLILDYWPLRRYAFGKGIGPVRSTWPLLREKIPLFALSGASAVVAYVAQSHAGYVMPYEAFEPGVRLANAFVSYAKYIWLTIFPNNLSVCYPHPARLLPEWLVLFSAALMLAVSAIAIKCARRAPYIFVGWCWFAITLLPVIGLVQLGDQAMADRYAYIPMIGLLIISAWAVPNIDIANMRRAAVAACAIVAALSVAAYVQTSYWRDAETLCRHVIRVNPHSRMGYGGLGSALAAKGKQRAAIECFQKAIKINPKDIASCINLGNSYAITGKLDESVKCYSQALALNCNDPGARYNFARVLLIQGKLTDAAHQLSMALKLQPSFVEAHVTLANISMLLDKTDDAIAHYCKAAKLAPLNADIHFRLAGAFEQNGRIGSAIKSYREAVRLDPRRWDAANNLAWILATQRHCKYFNAREAIRIAERSSRRIGHAQFELLDTLSVAYAAAGQYNQAIKWAKRGMESAKSANQASVARDISARLRQYESSRAKDTSPITKLDY